MAVQTSKSKVLCDLPIENRVGGLYSSSPINSPQGLIYEGSEKKNEQLEQIKQILSESEEGVEKMKK